MALLLSLPPEQGGPLPPSFASSRECLASCREGSWGRNNDGAAGRRILYTSWRSLHLGLVEDRKGDAIISLCFSLNTTIGSVALSWACLGHWWQVRLSKRRDCFLPTTPPQTSVSHCPKGTGWADNWAEMTESVLSILSSLLGVTSGQAGIQSFQLGCDPA